MLVKLTDIRISKNVYEQVQCPTKCTGIIDDKFLQLAEFNYDSLFHPSDTFDEKILRWAGPDVLLGKNLIFGLGNAERRRKAFLASTNLPDLDRKSIQISPQFLYYYLYLKRNQLSVTTRTGLRISKDKLSKLAVPVPCINAQLNVVSRLKKLVEKNDAHVAKTTKQIAALTKENQLAFSKAFKHLSCFLNDESAKPGDTNIIRMKDTCMIQAGKTPNGSIKAYFGNTYPFFTQLAFEQGRDIESAAKYLSARGIREAKLFEKDSILVCFIGPQFGKAGIARKSGACNSQILSITCSSGVVPEYLYYQVISPMFQQQMKQFSTSSSMSKSDFERLFIELPSVKKQLEVVAQLEKQHASFAEKMAELQAGLDKMEARQNDEFACLIVNSNS